MNEKAKGFELKNPRPKTENPIPSTENRIRRIESFKDLEVWQVSHALVLKIYDVTKKFPGEERFRLTDQLCRASASIPTNIAEGKGRNSLKEYIQFLSIARGSIEETKYLVLLSWDLKYFDEGTYTEIIGGYDRVGKMLNKLIGSLRACLSPKTQNRTPKTLNGNPK